MKPLLRMQKKAIDLFLAVFFSSFFILLTNTNVKAQANCNTTYCAECNQVGTQCLVTRSCPEGYDPATPNFCYDPTGASCSQGPLYSDCVQTTPPPGTQQCPTDHPNCTDLTGSLCNSAGGISQSCPLSGGRVGSCCTAGPTPDPDPYCGGHLQPCCGVTPNATCDLSTLTCNSLPATVPICCLANDPNCQAGVPLPQSTPTPEYRSSSGTWPPRTNPPDYYAPDYPVDGSREHISTPQERAIPNPVVGCSSIGDEEFHSLRPYQASPCFYSLGDIALMCANKLTLEGDYEYSPSDCRCSCGGCTCSRSGQASGCTCHCDCSKTVTLSTYVDVYDAELPIMGNTEDEVVNSQDQPNNEGIDHFAKVNEYVSWYLSGVNQRAEYGDPDGEYISRYDVVNFSGPVNRLLPWDRMSGERNDQVQRARRNGRMQFDTGGRHNQIVACQSEPGVAAACYTEGGQRIRIRNWGVDDVPIYSNFDSAEDYAEAWTEWQEDPENNLFSYIPLSSTEDRYGELQGTGTVTVTGGSVSNSSVTVLPAELFYPHLEEGRELTDLLQKTYLSKDFIEDDRNGDGEPDINVTKTKHVIPASPPQCDLTRVRTNPGDTINPTELYVSTTFTVSTSCEVPGNSSCDCSIDDEGFEDCICICTPGGAVCPGGTATVTVDLTNNMPLAQENFIRTVASPYSPLQRLFPKIGSGMPLEGIYDMPGYSLVNYLTPPGAELELTNVQNPGGFPMPPKLFYPHIGSIHQYFLNCIQTALRPEGYGPFCEQGHLNDEDWEAENPPEVPDDPGSIYPPLPIPTPTDVQVVPYPTVPPVNVPESCRTINGVPIEDIATTVFAETSNGAQNTETQRLIAWVMFNRALTGSAAPYTASNTILYQGMYNDSGGSYPPPTGSQITNTHLALSMCLLNPTACPNQSARFQNTLNIVTQVCLDQQAGQDDPTDGSIFFSHQSDLTRSGVSFNSCDELRTWLQNNMQNHAANNPGFGYHVGDVSPLQSWLPGSTTQVYQWGCYVLITGTDICAVDAGCR